MDNIQSTRLALIENLRILATYDATYEQMLASEIDAYNACYDADIE